jgi:hypothetical protein
MKQENGTTKEKRRREKQLPIQVFIEILIDGKRETVTSQIHLQSTAKGTIKEEYFPSVLFSLD